MAKAVGIDLGTTNSAVAVVEDSQPWVIPDGDGEELLPSCVGMSANGKLLVGQTALRQYAAAPERTIKSIKRQMGTAQTSKLGDREYLPQEIAAIILKSLKQRAEETLGEEIAQAVITVPAYFTDAQRQATKDAGEIAGLEVLQILNEPTAAALTYELNAEETEQVLVYDLGGGTFDVSIVEIAGDVTEVLASHGNNRLGGDDFDRRLQVYLADQFRQTHNMAVPEDATTQARLLQAAERVKLDLSSNAFVTVREAFLASKGKTALHLETEVSRERFEELIAPLLSETLGAIDRALEDAKCKAEDLDRVILVGGSTRIPLVQRLVAEHLGQDPIDSIQPELCVALGAALQAGVLTGEAVDAILVDVIPHSLGISVVEETPMGYLPGLFSSIIPRNSVIPVSRSEVYSTVADGQKAVEIEIFQGENAIAKENVPLGSFMVEDLPNKPAGELQVEVHFDFDLNGILTVTATEKGKGQKDTLVVNNAATSRMSSHDLKQSKLGIDALFELDEDDVAMAELLDEAYGTLEGLESDAAAKLQAAIVKVEKAMEADEDDRVEQLLEELKTLLAERETSPE
ncbi:Hsp70 family protein [Synechococcus sp. PCC 7336]|uniref:Hsp70 family protein n=1 Tax=Synechococcus sp. PCC 7336 TaxID=195250 RepID=UPI0003456277|nr:Hsp70 family protein [Synechococcus sp. PCC 7336]